MHQILNRNPRGHVNTKHAPEITLYDTW